jgi:hypothetical protein
MTRLPPRDDAVSFVRTDQVKLAASSSDDYRVQRHAGLRRTGEAGAEWGLRINLRYLSVPDVEQCDDLAGTDDLATYRETGLIALDKVHGLPSEYV